MSGNQVIYETTDMVPFIALMVDDKGRPMTGEDVRVDVFDIVNGNTVALSGQSLPEAGSIPGLYEYKWTHGYTQRATLAARIYYIDGNKTPTIDIFIVKIVDNRIYLTDKIDENDGQAI